MIHTLLRSAALLLIGVMFWTVVGLAIFASVTEACEPEAITPNTPTGIAGCERWGIGTASMFGPGDGVAMNFCIWELRHSDGCGLVKVTSTANGLVAVVPVVDFCDCYTGTADERIVDLQYGVVAALGLDRARGLWPVKVERVIAFVLPNTAMEAAQ